MYYVYILLSEKDKNFYTGFTENIKQRLDRKIGTVLFNYYMKAVSQVRDT